MSVSTWATAEWIAVRARTPATATVAWCGLPGSDPGRRRKGAHAEEGEPRGRELAAGEEAWCAGRGRGLAGGIPGADGRARMGAPMEGIASARIARHSGMTHVRAR
jgi:hypothetical protein